jgi:homoserine kinase
MNTETFVIKVPASTANIGPGFDTTGMALDLYLTMTVTLVDRPFPTSSEPLPLCFSFEIQYSGDSPGTISPDPHKNLITKTAQHIINVANKVRGTLVDASSRPIPVKVHVDNPIPLGRGLGSSGAAVVAGVILGDKLSHLELTKEQWVDAATVIEGHPDNVAASILGGLVVNCVKDITQDIPRPEESLDNEAALTHKLTKIIAEKERLVYSQTHSFSPSVQVLTLVPDYQLSTEKSRSVLPLTYSRFDAVEFD